jgi:hypothetical protein
LRDLYLIIEELQEKQGKSAFWVSMHFLKRAVGVFIMFCCFEIMVYGSDGKFFFRPECINARNLL